MTIYDVLEKLTLIIKLSYDQATEYCELRYIEDGVLELIDELKEALNESNS